MEITISEASAFAGVSIQTLYRKIKNGEISAITGQDKKKYIDTAELLRVYPNCQTPSGKGGTAEAGSLKGVITYESNALCLVLEEKEGVITLLKDMLKEKQQEIDILRAEKIRFEDDRRDAEKELRKLQDYICTVLEPKKALPKGTAVRGADGKFTSQKNQENVPQQIALLG